MRIKDRARQPITPPLIPMSLPHTPYIPSSPIGYLESLSDSASLVDADLEKSEKVIFEQDAILAIKRGVVHTSPSSGPTEALTATQLGDIYSPLASMDDTLTSPMSERIKAKDRRVDVPLMPTTPATPPNTVRVVDDMEGMLLGLSFTGEDKFAEEESVALDHPYLDKFFDDRVFKAKASQAVQQVEQEKLHQADTVSRLDVPLMSIEKPLAPWNAPLRGDGGLLGHAQIRESSRLLAQLPGSKRLDGKLTWVPFSKELAKVAWSENIEPDDSLQELVNADDDVVDSSALTWKPEGLRILRNHDNDDEEEDLELGVDGGHREVQPLVRKRHIQTEEEFPQGKQPSSSRRKKSNGKTACHMLLHPGRPGPPMLLGGAFSATDALDNFLTMRGSKKQELTSSSYFDAQKVAPPELVPEERILPDLPSQEVVTKSKAFPIPSYAVPSTTHSFLVSTTLFRQRSLARRITGLFPNANLIERDFSAHNATQWDAGSVVRSPDQSPLAHEADIIISASTGLLWTSLQHVKQKPLPGQKAKPTVREHIANVALRYERLIVLVNRGPVEGADCDESDLKALMELTGFCVGLGETVIVQFVAGGEETLAQWIVAAMVKYRDIDETPLLSEETLWEVFLRRLGLNALAAQVVISGLKAPDGLEYSIAQPAGEFGLTAFVEMSAEMRLQRFGHVLGGTRVLQRVSAVLDGAW